MVILIHHYSMMQRDDMCKSMMETLNWAFSVKEHVLDVLEKNGKNCDKGEHIGKISTFP